MRILKIRRTMLLIVLALIALALILLIHHLVLVLAPKAEETTLTIRSNGSVVLEEVSDLGGYSEKEYRTYLKDLVKSYNKGNDGGVKIRRVLRDGKDIYTETVYDSAGTYADFTGYTLWTGKASSVAEHLDGSTTAYAVKDGKKGSESALSDVSGDLHAVVIRENIHVVLPSDVRYVTGASSTPEKDGSVRISSPDGNADALETVALLY